ncbi:MAG: cytochrome c maturation protein CcmE [Acidobacteria bacterium]|nr:cytochrome c maturation protein CcmE [Acidobacteriota bacterium]
MQKKIKFGSVIAIVIGVLGWIAYSGVDETASYFKTIEEVHAMGPEAKDKKLRVGGYVVPGSIKRSGNQVDFAIDYHSHKMQVRYTGNEPLPDTFKDGSEALIDGRMGDQVFHATKVAAKCASKYEPKPRQNYKGNASTYDKKS